MEIEALLNKALEFGRAIGPGPGAADFPMLTLSGTMAEHSTPDLHLHSWHQLLRIRNGVTLLVDEVHTQPLFGSMTAFIPAGCRHRSTVIGDTVSYKSLYLDPEILPSAGNQIKIFEISDLGRALFERLDYAGGTAAPSEITRRSLLLFLEILQEDVADSSAPIRFPIADNPLNKRAINFIETHYHRRITLSDITADIPCTARHLSRVFRQELKLTVMDYLTLYRMLRASLLMQTGGTSIAEIAYGCGYDSHTSFYRDFRSVFSTTPRAFLQTLRR